jgi:hypothetical protein
MTTPQNPGRRRKEKARRRKKLAAWRDHAATGVAPSVPASVATEKSATK